MTRDQHCLQFTLVLSKRFQIGSCVNASNALWKLLSVSHVIMAKLELNVNQFETCVNRAIAEAAIVVWSNFCSLSPQRRIGSTLFVQAVSIFRWGHCCSSIWLQMLLQALMLHVTTSCLILLNPFCHSVTPTISSFQPHSCHTFPSSCTLVRPLMNN